MMFDLNPIDVLKQRKLNTIPPHFVKIKIAELDIFEGLEDWVKTKLKGRYCLAKHPSIDKTGSLRSTFIIGLEDQRESTYFMLACPYLRRT